jgi:hypothetical protein
MTADNRLMAVLPRAQEPEPGHGEGTVALDLIPRVRYRVRLSRGNNTKAETSPEISMASLCFDSGVLICPEIGCKSAVVVNLSDRIVSLKSGSRYGCTAPQQPPRQQWNGASRVNARRPSTSVEFLPQSAAAASTASSS